MSLESSLLLSHSPYLKINPSHSNNTLGCCTLCPGHAAVCCKPSHMFGSKVSSIFSSTVELCHPSVPPAARRVCRAQMLLLSLLCWASVTRTVNDEMLTVPFFTRLQVSYEPKADKMKELVQHAALCPRPASTAQPEAWLEGHLQKALTVVQVAALECGCTRSVQCFAQRSACQTWELRLGKGQWRRFEECSGPLPIGGGAAGEAWACSICQGEGLSSLPANLLLFVPRPQSHKLFCAGGLSAVQSPRDCAGYSKWRTCSKSTVNPQFLQIPLGSHSVLE